mmetsp:Transcript_28624/g.34863  ORF Transcript_28624/g.34863 Transcript_28624/m.34863 type:complete len:154 (-) Transcript_28624:29-490(-)|eukprot:CAMPEP_0172501820 /NCGR_PEP_ID=MMETSP1066-20121228/153859_1 /TAXON_ID=671091 /ORGANISM="Coscinodiscus wailesii, Strain CCMP2513" /LENGTH=153 /DNA_ID=CAMNT_0013276825 /DNA_START=57 /DNA_END=521 /DNA_ORIENTATION=+
MRFTTATIIFFIASATHANGEEATVIACDKSEVARCIATDGCRPVKIKFATTERWNCVLRGGSTFLETLSPSSALTDGPSAAPSPEVSTKPTTRPSNARSGAPSMIPSNIPSEAPTSEPPSPCAEYNGVCQEDSDCCVLPCVFGNCRYLSEFD